MKPKHQSCFIFRVKLVLHVHMYYTVPIGVRISVWLKIHRVSVEMKILEISNLHDSYLKARHVFQTYESCLSCTIFQCINYISYCLIAHYLFCHFQKMHRFQHTESKHDCLIDYAHKIRIISALSTAGDVLFLSLLVYLFVYYITRNSLVIPSSTMVRYGINNTTKCRTWSFLCAVS